MYAWHAGDGLLVPGELKTETLKLVLVAFSLSKKKDWWVQSQYNDNKLDDISICQLLLLKYIGPIRVPGVIEKNRPTVVLSLS